MEWQVSVEGRSIWLPRRNWASEFKDEGAAIQTAEFSLQSPCTICVEETGKERMSGDAEREDVWLYSQTRAVDTQGWGQRKEGLEWDWL